MPSNKFACQANKGKTFANCVTVLCYYVRSKSRSRVANLNLLLARVTYRFAQQTKEKPLHQFKGHNCASTKGWAAQPLSNCSNLRSRTIKTVFASLITGNVPVALNWLKQRRLVLRKPPIRAEKLFSFHVEGPWAVKSNTGRFTQ